MSIDYRPIYGIEHYRIGDDGRAWSCLLPGSKGRKRGEWRLLAANRNSPKGYLFLRLSIAGREVNRYLHRLVLEAFDGPCPPDHECLHRDGNRLNNRRDNLRWGTRRENSADTAAHGRTLRGEKNLQAKLRESDVHLIHEIKRDTPGATFVDIGILLGVSADAVRSAYYGKNWGWLREVT